MLCTRRVLVCSLVTGASLERAVSRIQRQFVLAPCKSAGAHHCFFSFRPTTPPITITDEHMNPAAAAAAAVLLLPCATAAGAHSGAKHGGHGGGGPFKQHSKSVLLGITLTMKDSYDKGCPT
jgi:hypothetical protein